MTGFSIPERGDVYWAKEMVKRFPGRWSNDVARKPGGKLFALFQSIGSDLDLINDELIQALAAARLQTATGIQLDVIANDFYGELGLPRQPDESDDSYRTRIEIGLFQPLLTKQAFIDLIGRFTGEIPRVIDDWMPQDTAAFDWSGWDADSAATPSLYGDAGERYQGFIITVLPTLTPPTLYPQWGFDFGSGWDSNGTFLTTTINTNFQEEKLLDDLIERIGMFGGTWWRKYLFPSQVPSILTVSYSPATGLSTIPIRMPFLNSPFSVIVSSSWMSSDYVTQPIPTGFVINASTANPGGAAMLNYAVIPVNIAGSGFQFVTPASRTATINIPNSATGARAMVTPSWDTTVWITSETLTQLGVHFGTDSPAEDAQLNWYFFPSQQSGLQPVTQDSLSIDIPVNVSGDAAPFALPSWNTQLGVYFKSGSCGRINASSGQIQFTVNAPVPAGSKVLVSGSWNAQLAVKNITTTSFDVLCNIGAPGGATLSYIVIPPSATNAGSASLSSGATTATITPPVGFTSANAVAFTPSWRTAVYIESLINDLVLVRFSVPPPDGSQTLTWYFFDSNHGGSQVVPIGGLNTSIEAVVAPNAQFMTPSWNTTIGITLALQAIKGRFDTAAQANAFVEWGQAPQAQLLHVDFQTPPVDTNQFLHWGWLATT